MDTKNRNKLTQKQIRKILKKGAVQVSCDKWSEEVKSNVKKVEKTFGQNLRKDIEQLKRQRKN